MNKLNLVNKCIDYVERLYHEIESKNSANFYDINTVSEDIVAQMLNIIHDWKLINLNHQSKNNEVIDLADDERGIAIQVTTETAPSKIHSTIQKFIEKELYKKYKSLYFVILGRKDSYKANFTKSVDGKFDFKIKDNIILQKNLIEMIQKINDIEKLQKLCEFFKFNLDYFLNQRNALTSKAAFVLMDENSNGYLAENYFDIIDQNFKDEFKRAYENDDVIYIKTSNREEGQYCVLNEIHKIDKHALVYLIKDEETWGRAENIISDSVLIPAFKFDDNLLPISNNKTIFITESQTVKSNQLILEQRPLAFLAKQLKNNGYKDANLLIEKTHGLFQNIKNILLNSSPISSSYNRASKIAILLGGWVEYSKDISLIEELYPRGYEVFLDEINDLLNDKTIITKSQNNEIYYELSDREISFNSISYSIIDSLSYKKFINSIKSIVFEGIFYDEILDSNQSNYNSQQKYSELLVKSALRSLTLLNIYHGIKTDEIVSQVFDNVNNFKNLEKAFPFLNDLCQTSPEAFLDWLEVEKENNNSFLLELFQNGDNNTYCDLSSGLLSELSQLLLTNNKENALRALKILIWLATEEDDSHSENNARDCLKKVLNPYFQFTIFNNNEIRKIIENSNLNNDFLWNIIYEIVMNLSPGVIEFDLKFLYRDSGSISNYSDTEFTDQWLYYGSYLINNADTFDKIVKLIDFLPHCRIYEIFCDILNLIDNNLTKYSDEDKEIIRRKLCEFLYYYRFYNKVKCSIPEKYLQLVDNLTSKIKFENPIFDYLFLFDYPNIKLVQPIENESVIDKLTKEKLTELKNSNIDIVSFLSCLPSNNSGMIGKAIALSDDIQFNSDFFKTISESTQFNSVSIHYIQEFLDSGKDDVLDEAISIVEENKKINLDLLAGLINLIPNELIYLNKLQSLPNDLKKKTLSKENRYIKSKSHIKELILFEEWDKAFHLISQNLNDYSTQDLINLCQKVIQEYSKIKEKSHNFYSFSVIFKELQNRTLTEPQYLQEVSNLELQFNDFYFDLKLTCFFKMSKSNPEYFVHSLDRFYFRSTNKDSNYFNREKLLEFSPPIMSKDNTEILDNWIEKFIEYMDKYNFKDQTYLILGILLYNASDEVNYYYPPEPVRNFIEKITDKSQLNEVLKAFISKVICQPIAEVFTNGVREKELSDKYRKIYDSILIEYPNTAQIFKRLYERFERESKEDRALSQNKII